MYYAVDGTYTFTVIIRTIISTDVKYSAEIIVLELCSVDWIFKSKYNFESVYEIVKRYSLDSVLLHIASRDTLWFFNSLHKRIFRISNFQL